MVVKQARKFHKWLMLVVGLQFLIWGITGLYMVTMDIHFIHGESLAKSHPKKKSLRLNDVKIDLNTLVDLYPNAQNITLKQLLNQPVYELSLIGENEGKPILINAVSGEKLPVIQKQLATKIATHFINDSYSFRSISLITTHAPSELSSRHLPAWQVNFNHWTSPTIYVNQYTGEVVTKRHSYWRVFDWMWRFHIMDYDDGENISNSFLLIVVIIALMGAIAGIVLTYIKTIKPFIQKFTRSQKQLNSAINVKKSPSFYRINKFLHQWLAVIVGIQLMIWLATGLYFNVMDHNKASGNVNRVNLSTQQNAKEYTYIPIHALGLTSVQRIHIRWILDKPYYQVVYKAGNHQYQKQEQVLIDAQTGLSFSLSVEHVNTMALNSYSGDGAIIETKLVQPPIDDLPNERNSVWQVNFNDLDDTSVYIRQSSARVIAHVTNDRRLRDLMFTLHFMDYSNKGGFNNPQIIIFAGLMLLFSISGIYWLFHLILTKQFYRRKKSTM